MKTLPEGTEFVFGESHYADRERFGPLLGPQIEIVYIRTGQVDVIADDRHFDARAPAVLLAATARHLEYRYRTEEFCDVLWCQCTGANLTEEIITTYRGFSGVLPASEASTTLIRLGADLPLRVGVDMPDFVSSLAQALLQEFIGRWTCGIATRDMSRVDLIRRHLEDHFDKDITMTALSETFSLSPQHINRLFQAAYGENALDFLWRQRVLRGAFMLRHTGMPISQIAYKTGFKTPNHFSRLIRHEYGLSPRALRIRDWQGNR